MLTKVEITGSTFQSDIQVGDIGYIDNWVTAADGRPYAMVVRLKDGYIDFVNFHSMKAVGFIYLTAEDQ